MPNRPHWVGALTALLLSSAASAEDGDVFAALGSRAAAASDATRARFADSVARAAAAGAAFVVAPERALTQPGGPARSPAAIPGAATRWLSALARTNRVWLAATVRERVPGGHRL